MTNRSNTTDYTDPYNPYMDQKVLHDNHASCKYFQQLSRDHTAQKKKADNRAFYKLHSNSAFCSYFASALLCFLLLFLRSPAIFLGFTILGEIFAMWPFFIPTIEGVTFHLHGWWMLSVFASIHPSRTWMSGSFEFVQWNACVHRLELGLYSHLKEFSGNGVRTHANSKEKIHSTRKILLRGLYPWHCIKQGSQPNTLPAELFQPPTPLSPLCFDIHTPSLSAHFPMLSVNIWMSCFFATTWQPFLLQLPVNHASYNYLATILPTIIYDCYASWKYMAIGITFLAISCLFCFPQSYIYLKKKKVMKLNGTTSDFF